MIKHLLLIIIIAILITSELYSQCACMGGAPVGSLTPVGGTTNIGILKENHLRASSFFSSSRGDKYLSGDSPAERGLVHNFNSNFLGFLLGYGATEDFTIDLELGYYLYKSQEFDDYLLSGNGFSHATLYGKYNVFASRANQLEWTIGAGGRIPLNFDEQNLPQNIQSSTGAYGGVLLSFLHKGFKSAGLHFILVNRIELNAENKSSYKYGTSFINSLFSTKNITANLSGILELRNDIRLKDKYLGDEINESGWNIIILSPQINYGIGNFNISAFFDLPIYKYYNGKQLTNSYTFGLSLMWQAKMTN